MRPLTEEERAYLYVHYEQAMETPLGSALTGNHWLLIAALNSLGYSANSPKKRMTCVNGYCGPVITVMWMSSTKKINIRHHKIALRKAKAYAL